MNPRFDYETVVGHRGTIENVLMNKYYVSENHKEVIRMLYRYRRKDRVTLCQVRHMVLNSFYK